MSNTLTLLDLFSGIGGFSYGFERTNRIKTIAFCEKDKFCQKVLNKHWQGIKIYDDIRNINGSEIKADIITGGFPCQPFSIAGKRRGQDDDRYLWNETIRVVAETKPRWFVGENVDGIINIANGTILQQIQKDLEAENFQVQCLVIPASGIGAWHQRKRVWIIGYSNSNANAEKKQRSNGKEDSIQKEYWSKDSAVQFTGGTNNNNVSNSNGKQRNGCSQSTRERVTKQQRLDSEKKRNRNEIWSQAERCSEQAISNTNNIGHKGYELQSNNLQKTKKPNQVASSGIREQQTWWQTQSKLCGVPDGISYGLDKDRANRIKSLGNSIVPEIAYLIATSILKAEDGKKETNYT
jgi:DNA (cytosine-5)-methyltransferase 1